MKFNFPKEKLMLSKKQLAQLSDKQINDLLMVLYSIEDTLGYKCKNVSDTINYIQRTYCKEVDYEGKITIEKVNDLLYDIRNEFDNELDYDYESDYKQELEESDFNMLMEFLDRYLHKVELCMKEELKDNGKI